MERWLDSPLVDDIFFFGGSERGIQIGVDAVARGKKPVLELAGNDGFVVWKDADLDLAAEALTESFFGSGQICMVPKYAIAHPAIAIGCWSGWRAWSAKIRPGYPEDPDVLLSPVLRSDDYFPVPRRGDDRGAERASPAGTGWRSTEPPRRTGLFLAPTVLRVDGLAGARELDGRARGDVLPAAPGRGAGGRRWRAAGPRSSPS